MQISIRTDETYTPDWAARGARRVVQNVINLAQLVRYEVAYNRTLGIAPGLIDRSAPDAEALYAAALTELIRTNEPRATVLRIDQVAAGTAGEIHYEVVLDIVS